MDFIDELRDPFSAEALALKEKFRSDLERAMNGTLVKTEILGFEPGSVNIIASVMYDTLEGIKDPLNAAMRNISSWESLSLDSAKTLLDAPILCSDVQNVSQLRACALANFQALFLELPDNLRTRGVTLINGTSPQNFTVMTDVELKNAVSSFKSLVLVQAIKRGADAVLKDAASFMSPERISLAMTIAKAAKKTFNADGANQIMNVFVQFVKKRFSNSTSLTAEGVLSSAKGGFVSVIESTFPQKFDAIFAQENSSETLILKDTICEKTRQQLSILNAKLEACAVANISGNASYIRAFVTTWYTENPGFVPGKDNSSELATKALSRVSAIGLSPVSNTTFRTNSSNFNNNSRSDSCNGVSAKTRRAVCVIQQIFSGNAETISSLLQMAGLMKQFLGKPLPLETMSETELIAGFATTKAVIYMIRAARSDGRPAPRNIDEFFSPALTESVQSYMTSQGLPFSLTAARKVAKSVDDIFKSTPASDPEDPTGSLISAVNSASPVIRRNITIKFANESYLDAFADWANASTKELVQKINTHLRTGIKTAGGDLLAFIPSRIWRNGTTVVDGSVVYDPAIASGDAGDPLTAMLQGMRTTKRLGDMTIDADVTTAQEFVPCGTSVNATHKYLCLWNLFTTKASVSQMKEIVNSIGSSAAKVSTNAWTDGMIASGMETLQAYVGGCRAKTRTAAFNFTPSNFLEDGSVATEASSILEFKNVTRDNVTATVLAGLLENYLKKYDSSFSFSGVCTSLPQTKQSSVSMRFGDTFISAYNDNSSVEFKTKADEIIAQVIAAMAARNEYPTKISVNKMSPGSINADIQASVDSTSTTDPLVAVKQEALASGSLGGIPVLGGGNITCSNESTNCSCFWSYWRAIDTAAEFADIAKLLPASDALTTVPTEADFTIMREGFSKMVDIYRTVKAETDVTKWKNVTTIADVFDDSAIQARVSGYFSLTKNATYNNAGPKKLAASLNSFIGTSFPGTDLSQCLTELRVPLQKSVTYKFAMDYKDTYDDSNSQDYKDFVNRFMTNFKSEVSSRGGTVLDMTILRLTRGSTVVDSTVTYTNSPAAPADPVDSTTSSSNSSSSLGDMPVNSSSTVTETTTTSTTVASTTSVSGSSATGIGSTISAGATATTASGVTGTISTTTSGTGSTTVMAGGASTTKATTVSGASTTAGAGSGSGTATSSAAASGTSTATAAASTTKANTVSGASTTAGAGSGSGSGTATSSAAASGTTTKTTATSAGGTATTTATSSGTATTKSASGTSAAGAITTAAGTTAITTQHSIYADDPCASKEGLDFHRCVWDLFRRLDTQDTLVAEINKLDSKPQLTTVQAWNESDVSSALYSFQHLIVAQLRRNLLPATAKNLTQLSDLWSSAVVTDATKQMKDERNMTFNLDRAKVLADIFDKRTTTVYAYRNMTGAREINGLRPAASRQASFEINRDFKDVYADLRNPETMLFIAEICKAITATLDANNGKLIDCIVLRLRKGSTIADVKLVYESDPLAADQVGSPDPDVMDASINSIKTSGKIGSLPVDPKTLAMSSKSNVDPAVEEARIIKELEERDRRLLMTVTLPAFVVCTGKLGAWCCNACCIRNKQEKLV
ncbi:unnamed protein product [Notodromas monacha]|uniref:SEA domain-containing protein n=1 Tax=Notodromas monacha TaxID=399045 RepID=A0A7R9BG57_9CRUS|nr:unnamed protein product [Notodromas monacha]CAG0913501.1 unnamed protein product [Notodromas monacha]